MRHNKKFVFEFKKTYVLKQTDNRLTGDYDGFSFKKL